MNTKPTNEFDNFIDAFVDELIATPDDHVLDGRDSTAVQAKGLDLLRAAKQSVSKSRLAAAKAGYASLKSAPALVPQTVSADEARSFLARAANDNRFTLAARNLGDLPDDEAIALYTKIKSIVSREEDDK